MNDRPLVTVVMPSYNKGRYVRAAVESVLGQTYSNIELSVYDPGSTDGSLDVLRSFGDRLTLHAEPDRGQSDALNKGFRAAKGDILCWLNADDVFFPDAVERAVRHFIEGPSTMLIYGRGWHIDEQGKKIRAIENRAHNHRLLINVDYILQPATFFRREVFERVGEINADYNWGLDWDYWIRVSKKYPLKRVEDVFAMYRLTPDIKSFTGGRPRLRELARITRRHGGVFEPTSVVFGAKIVAGRLIEGFSSSVQKGVQRVLTKTFKVFYGSWAMYG